MTALSLIAAWAMFLPAQDTLAGAGITASAKQIIPIEKLASTSASVTMEEISERGLTAPKSLGGIVPNLNTPDYGSSMTSSIYMRGFGSRIDNPVVGLYIDDVPVMDKNAYDTDFLDIRRVDFLSGPQGTLYGRNSLTGLLSLTTLAPGDYNGLMAMARIGSAGRVRANVSAYNDTFGGALAFSRSDGFHVNEFDGSRDRGNSLSGRFRMKKDISPTLKFENLFWAGALEEGGYPYRQYIDGELFLVNYNRESGYRRLNFTEAVKLDWYAPKFTLGSITSFQGLFDRMDMDQDFTTADMFTLRQSQKQLTLTQELILRPRRHPSWWNHQSGVFGFYKRNKMSAPVVFRPDGINSLILSNANKGLGMLGYKTAFLEDNFPITSDFRLITYNIAAYHESWFTLGKWTLGAGLRLDYEGNHMDYDSEAFLHLAIIPADRDFRTSDFKEALTTYEGGIGESGFQILPKLSAVRDFSLGEGLDLKFFMSGAKGYKAGGFNTQIFSDILQSRLMEEQYNVFLTDNPVTAENTRYRPETSLDAETGFKFSRQTESSLLNLSFTAFYISCRNQQITVFPPGKSTGRMMKNAGRSHSAGVEASAAFSWKGLEIDAAYGFTDARFDRFNDGNNDYSGKHVPYAPANTVYARASYTVETDATLRKIVLGADWNGRGRIWWNEDNTLSDPLRGDLGADVSFHFGKYILFARADNITGEQSPVFYFKSVGNSFFQLEKPFRWDIGLRLAL